MPYTVIDVTSRAARNLVDVTISCLQMHGALIESINWKALYMKHFPDDFVIPLSGDDTWQNRYARRFNAGVYACGHWNGHNSFGMRRLISPFIKGIRKVRRSGNNFLVLAVSGRLLQVVDHGLDAAQETTILFTDVVDFYSQGPNIIATLENGSFCVIEMGQRVMVAHFPMAKVPMTALTATDTWAAGAINSSGQLFVMNTVSGDYGTVSIPEIDFDVNDTDASRQSTDMEFQDSTSKELSRKAKEAERRAQSGVNTPTPLTHVAPEKLERRVVIDTHVRLHLKLATPARELPDDPVVQAFSRSSDCVACVHTNKTSSDDSDFESGADLLLLCLTKKGHLLYTLVDYETLTSRASEQIEQIHDVLRPDENFVQIAGHSDSLILLTSQGRLYQFAYMLEDDHFKFKNTNVIVPAVEDVVSLSSSGIHSVALNKTGAVYTWGFELFDGAACFGLGNPQTPEAMINEFRTEKNRFVDVGTPVRINCPQASYAHTDGLCTMVICDDPNQVAEQRSPANTFNGGIGILTDTLILPETPLRR